ncbi:hypothetical protein GQ53DRAFT_878257 [Thozetella sp. PMI_491]|nr:hypothetical protein GQ53DRAFT_878257 [Thozetella sp. PMI_491]
MALNLLHIESASLTTASSHLRDLAIHVLSRRHRTGIAALLLFVLFTAYIYRLPQIYLASGFDAVKTSGPPASAQSDLSRAEAPFIGWPLGRVCGEATWTPGLVFICDNNSGGIGNIRNYILTCLRYAIEAGATGLVMPRIRTRSPDDLSSITREHRPFDYFFDDKHFRDNLALHCPRMTIYNGPSDVPNNPDPSRSERITPRHLGSRAGCDQRDLNRHADRFGAQFRDWLQQSAKDFSLPEASAAHPRVVGFNWGVQWDFPVYRDGPEFVATFGGLLKLRHDILSLGLKTVELMRARAQGGDNGAVPAFYAGVHLRTENDALANWPDFEEQSSAYLTKLGSLGFQYAYLATGNDTEAAKFAGEAFKKHGIKIATKHTLLADHSKEYELLQSLTWDQQALVDFVTLLESSYFVGVSPSSFSMNVALKRHLQKDGLNTRPWKVGGVGDGRSWLVGNYASYWDDWLFMYDSLWP